MFQLIGNSSFPLVGQMERHLFSVDAILSPYIYVFYASFLVSFFFTPIMRSIAMHYGIIDQPDNMRKVHRDPVAYLGGVAVFLGWIAGLALSQFITLHTSTFGVAAGHVHIAFSIVVGACIIIVLGLLDDIRQINPWVKVGGQIVAAIVVLYFSGIGTRSTRRILNPLDLRLQIFFGWDALPDWFFVLTGSLLTIAIIVFCCNATNLMDGLDGLCGGVTAIIAAGFLFLAVNLGLRSGLEDAEWVAALVVLALALLGGVLGFVPFNFNPASIFMGDTGSMFLGFACAVLIVHMAEVDGRWLLASMVMFALPVLDTSLAFARRWVNRRPVFSPDKHHLHHQLVARGLSVKQTVIVSYGLAIMFILLGSTIVFMRTRYAVAIYLVIFGSIIVAAFKMGMIHEKPLVVTRRPLGELDRMASGPMEAGSILEVRSDDTTDIRSPAGAIRAGGFAASQVDNEAFVGVAPDNTRAASGIRSPATRD